MSEAQVATDRALNRLEDMVRSLRLRVESLEDILEDDAVDAMDWEAKADQLEADVARYKESYEVAISKMNKFSQTAGHARELLKAINFITEQVTPMYDMPEHTIQGTTKLFISFDELIRLFKARRSLRIQLGLEDGC